MTELEKQNVKVELIGQIIDVFEDFLEEKGIVIDNPEREEDENVDPETTAIIYGSDYGNLSDNIEAIIHAWKLDIPAK